MMNKQTITDLQVFDEHKFNKTAMFDGLNTKTFLLNFTPGQSLPAHRHPGSDVILVVIEGEGTCHVDETTHILKTHEAMNCHPDESLSIENKASENLSVMVTLSKLD